MDLNKAFPILIQFEGTAFTKAVGDRGKATKYGISQEFNPDIDVENLTEAQALQIYQDRYWIPAHCNDAPNQLKYVLFDTAVNDGVVEAIKILQHATGIPVDGIWGNQTYTASLNLSTYSYLSWRVTIYNQIVTNDPTQAKWLTGWLNRIDRIKAMLENGELQ